ncbi:MAG: glycosyltransferase [Calditrichaceae bacterium]
MKILFLTSRLPFPPIGGDKLRTFNFLRYLKQKYEVTLISFIENETELQNISEYRKYYDKLISVTLPKVNSYKNSFIGLFSSKPLQVHYYNSDKMRKVMENELKNGYDAVFCHLIRMAQYLPESKNIRKVVDFTDAISLNYERSKQFRKGLFSIINYVEAKRVYHYEQSVIKKSYRSIFISDIDADFLRNDQNTDKINIVANGVDLDMFQFYAGAYKPNQICFVGNMRTFPNTDAVNYFVKEVFPILKRVNKELKFYIVGNEPPAEIRNLHNAKDIIVTGFVESVIPHITNSAVLVAPMRVGAGIQNKILEAMALGTPVVTTTIGAEGLNNDMALIGDTPEELSDKILSILNDRELRRDKARAAREYIEKNFRWEKVFKDLEENFVYSD